MMVNEGDTIKLPCVVDRLDNFVIMWKKVNYHIRELHQRPPSPREVEYLHEYLI